VTGGVAQLRNLCPYLTQQLEVAFNSFHYVDQFGYPSKGQSPAVEPIFSQSLSLAVEGLRKPRNPAINLLKGQFAKEGQGFKPIWAKWGHTVRVAMTALVFLFVWDSFRSTYARNMADTAHIEMKSLGASVAGLSRVNSGRVPAINKFLLQQKKVERSRAAATKVKDLNSAMSILDQISASLRQIPLIHLKSKLL
jgi:general secretion pathway protein L